MPLIFSLRKRKWFRGRSLLFEVLKCSNKEELERTGKDMEEVKIRLLANLWMWRGRSIQGFGYEFWELFGLKGCDWLLGNALESVKMKMHLKFLCFACWESGNYTFKQLGPTVIINGFKLSLHFPLAPPTFTLSHTFLIFIITHTCCPTVIINGFKVSLHFPLTLSTFNLFLIFLLLYQLQLSSLTKQVKSNFNASNFNFPNANQTCEH